MAMVMAYLQGVKEALVIVVVAFLVIVVVRRRKVAGVVFGTATFNTRDPNIWKADANAADDWGMFA